MERKTPLISQEALRQQEEISDYLKLWWQNQGITPVAYVETYGCQQNEADSEQIRGILERCGYGLTDTAEGADLVVINTCAIREHAAQRVFGNVGALVHTKRRHPGQKIFVCGCMMGQPEISARMKNSYAHVDGIFSPLAVPGAALPRADPAQKGLGGGGLRRVHCRGPAAGADQSA